MTQSIVDLILGLMAVSIFCVLACSPAAVRHLVWLFLPLGAVLTRSTKVPLECRLRAILFPLASCRPNKQKPRRLPLNIAQPPRALTAHCISP